ncbi:uncharacterized protein LOC133788320 [Humulus lupulus]|uniref:uncharacterized protein LOC133788320 n=1 Tax=Humulus lupulus TaxID=3486 RepID=UPI002B403C1B|nr:uncharacterized protein LOC133788320 [Humulus lupulus]
MATRRVSNSLVLLFLSLLISCCSGIHVGFSHHAGGTIRPSSLDETISFLKENNVSPSLIRVFVSDHKLLSTFSNTGVSIDLYLSHSQLQNLIKSKSSSVSWLKAHVVSLLPRVNIKSIIATTTVTTSNTRQNELPTLLSGLKLLHSLLSSSSVDNRVKVSTAFPLSFFKNLSTGQEEDLSRIISYIKEKRSFIIVEATMDEEELIKTRDSPDELFVESIIQKANSAISSSTLLNDVPMVLTIKSPVLLSSKEVAEFSDKVSKSLQNNTQIRGKLIGLYAELLTKVEDFEVKELRREKEQIFHTSARRQLLTKLDPETPLHETIFPTTPTIVTVPSSNPVTITPVSPLDTPVPFPLTTPVNVPVTYPSNTPAPITVPGAQPITNPVTTYPPPLGTVPTTTPVPTNPIPPPAPTGNSPSVSGQSWCIAKSGSAETALQSALDYACGSGADCSQIQQGGACYNPNTLQSHASFAFNSYYQKNPAPTSCEFGGTATLVTTNPSTGSCVFPTSSSSSSTPASPFTVTPTPVTPTPPTPMPVTPTPSTPATPTVTNPAAGTPSPSWGVVSGSGSTPPTVLNSSTGTTPDFGLDSPPGFNTSTSKAGGLRPFIGFIFLVTSLITKSVVLGI